jgi:hypothetical protein
MRSLRASVFFDFLCKLDFKVFYFFVQFAARRVFHFVASLSFFGVFPFRCVYIIPLKWYFVKGFFKIFQIFFQVFFKNKAPILTRRAGLICLLRRLCRGGISERIVRRSPFLNPMVYLFTHEPFAELLPRLAVRAKP